MEKNPVLKIRIRVGEVMKHFIMDDTACQVVTSLVEEMGRQDAAGRVTLGLKRRI